MFTALDLTHFGANKPMNSSPGSYKEVSNEYEIGGSSEALANLHRLVDTTIAERLSIQRGEIHSRVPGDWLLPYVHQRYDNLSPVGEE